MRNRIHKLARVHRDTCLYIKIHGGVSTTVPPTGWYHEGFATADDALAKARSTGRDAFICQRCSPQLSGPASSLSLDTPRSVR